MNTPAWYVALDGERHGPFTPGQIRELVAQGRIDAETAVWRHPMPDWKPIDEVPALDMTLPPPLPESGTQKSPDKETEDAAGGAHDELRPIHPWRRYFARMADISLFGFVATRIIALLTAHQAPETHRFFFVEEGGRSMLSLVLLLLFIPVESWMLATWGQTPGKWMLSLRVENQESRRPYFITALGRSAYVWMRGLAAGIPIVYLVTMLVAARHLKEDRETTWDRDLDLQVVGGGLHLGRVALIVIVLVGVLYLLVVGQTPKL